ncbi:MAG: MoxR family ATPase [Methylotenera sp.]|uniref:AAA family ATPase n=1 Tax=Methylotenera TaxID=359407 RepID=UPI00037DDBAE|nr:MULTISPECIES: MoxR family ATPase [Methylotenera]PPC84565.1 MAG: MoxR family ATPase [Methylotenera sp.]PPC97369.1 MAG: MoxR family ATPase [Methylotenera sp.]PPD01141.1 MAG: MoxR family ATPase [Methylotenera sp.]
MSEVALQQWRNHALALEQALNHVVLGLKPAVRLLIISIFSRGHVLLEGNVGVGKTTLLRAAARGIGGGYQRVEGTIDLMPQDLIYHTYISSEGKPKVDPGPLLMQGENLSVFFFNEINRARPQVHSLLLRVMAERSVSAFNREYQFPHLQVFADRNAVEKEETFELPGAARDRFLMEIEIAPENDTDIHKALTFDSRFHDTDQLIESVTENSLNFSELSALAPIIQNAVVAGSSVQDFVEHLRRATHRPQDYGIHLPDVEMDELMIAGIGPRGSSMLVRAAKVSAWLNGRAHLTPEDIASVFHEVVAHRVFFRPIYELQRTWLARAYTQAILNNVPTP